MIKVVAPGMWVVVLIAGIGYPAVAPDSRSLRHSRVGAVSLTPVPPTRSWLIAVPVFLRQELRQELSTIEENLHPDSLPCPPFARQEIDFVGANVVMAIIADFMLVWLPAPTMSYTCRVYTNNKLMSFLSKCPENAFQKVRRHARILLRLAVVLASQLQSQAPGSIG